MMSGLTRLDDVLGELACLAKMNNKKVKMPRVKITLPFKFIIFI
jgi:hypothetical protein